MSLLAGVLIGLGACSNGDIYGQHSSGPGASTGRAGTGTGSSGGSGTSGGSTTASVGTCNPNPNSCPSFGSQDPMNLCGSGEVELVANFVEFDFQNGTTPITCSLGLDDLNGNQPPATDQCGYLHYCAPPGTQISLTTQNVPDGYVPMNFATVLMNQNAQIPNRPGIPMVKGSIVGSLNQVLPDADPTEAMVVVNIQTLELTGCTDKSGWSLGLVDANGVSVDAGVAYVVSGVPDPQAPGTDTTGIAFFYNIDPSAVSTVSPRGSKSSNQLPDGGVLCANPEKGPPLGLTGSVPLASGVLSVLPFVVAPSG